MRVISIRTLREFWQSEPRHRSAEGPLKAWKTEVETATWRSPADVKERFRSASILKGGRIVFNIKGNAYRLIVSVNYPAQIVFICWVGTHEDYDRVDAETIRWT